MGKPCLHPSNVPERTEKFRAAFHAVDVDGSGSLSRAEIRSLLASIGECPNEYELDGLFQKIDKGHDDSIDFEEFLHISEELMKFQTTTKEPSHTVDIEELQGDQKAQQVSIAVLVLILYWVITVLYGALRQNWTVLDASYFAIITFTTIGYGDLSFKGTAFDKIFGGFYVFFGVAFISAAIGVILDYVAQKQEQQEKQIETAAELQPATEQFSLDSELRKLYLRCLKNAALIVITCFFWSRLDDDG